jgi:hypothetical protein
VQSKRRKPLAPLDGNAEPCAGKLTRRRAQAAAGN